MASRTTTTIRLALVGAAERFARAGCESPRLDAEILLAEALRASRAHLLTHDDEVLPPDTWQLFQAWAARREKREPVAYIIGRREFYGLDFAVSPAVLIPRPETEHLVEEALALAGRLSLRMQRSDPGASITIADVGTGSGAIAVSLAAHLPRARICAVDASEDALTVARRNAERHGVEDRLRFVQSDLLENLPWPADILAANLPYVSDADWDTLAPEIRLYEPALALRAGADGLDAIRRMLDQSPAHLQPGGAVCLEIGEGQAGQVREMSRAAFPGAAIRIVRDYAGLDRIVVIET
jgi:release factor glutamine methyltransferase